MDAFTGEIRVFFFDYSPGDWMKCEGQELPVDRYAPLFSIIGNRYGGNGYDTFRLPDLRGRTAVGAGQLTGGERYELGKAGGVEEVTLDNGTAAHQHVLNAAISTSPVGLPAKLTGAPSSKSYFSNMLEQQGTGYNTTSLYTNRTPDTPLHSDAVSWMGDGKPHTNMQPSMAVSYCICIRGTHPQRPR